MGHLVELGAVLTCDAPGRQSDDVITLFDSPGLAIPGLGIANTALAKADELDLPTLGL